MKYPSDTNVAGCLGNGGLGRDSALLAGSWIQRLQMRAFKSPLGRMPDDPSAQWPCQDTFQQLELVRVSSQLQSRNGNPTCAFSPNAVINCCMDQHCLGGVLVTPGFQWAQRQR